jgi:exonuclease III
MQLLALNIRQGGGTRIAAIADYLVEQNCNALVISEFRRNASGDQLLARLRQAGYSYFHYNDTEPKQNTVMVATKQPSTPIDINGCSNGWSLAGVTWDGIQLVGVYFPQRKDKAGVFDTLETMASSNLLAIGDFNTGSNALDAQGAKFHCADQFVHLANDTLTDLWRIHNGQQTQEFSWYSRASNGFRIDHALAGAGAASRCVGSYYDHSTRDAFTDHSGLIVELCQ